MKIDRIFLIIIVIAILAATIAKVTIPELQEVTFKAKVLDNYTRRGGGVGFFATIEYRGQKHDIVTGTISSIMQGNHKSGFEAEKGQILEIQGTYNRVTHQLMPHNITLIK